jgi:hypothetical protein
VGDFSASLEMTTSAGRSSVWLRLPRWTFTRPPRNKSNDEPSLCSTLFVHTDDRFLNKCFLDGFDTPTGSAGIVATLSQFVKVFQKEKSCL